MMLRYVLRFWFGRWSSRVSVRRRGTGYWLADFKGSWLLGLVATSAVVTAGAVAWEWSERRASARAWEAFIAHVAAQVQASDPADLLTTQDICDSMDDAQSVSWCAGQTWLFGSDRPPQGYPAVHGHSAGALDPDVGSDDAVLMTTDDGGDRVRRDFGADWLAEAEKDSPSKAYLADRLGGLTVRAEANHLPLLANTWVLCGPLQAADVGRGCRSIRGDSLKRGPDADGSAQPAQAVTLGPNWAELAGVPSGVPLSELPEGSGRALLFVLFPDADVWPAIRQALVHPSIRGVGVMGASDRTYSHPTGAGPLTPALLSLITTDVSERVDDFRQFFGADRLLAASRASVPTPDARFIVIAFVTR